MRMAFALGLIQALPAGKDDIGPGEKPRFGFQQPRRGVLEGGKFVHAVKDHGIGGQVIAEGQRHRRVIPHKAPLSRPARPVAPVQPAVQQAALLHRVITDPPPGLVPSLHARLTELIVRSLGDPLPIGLVKVRASGGRHDGPHATRRPAPATTLRAGFGADRPRTSTSSIAMLRLRHHVRAGRPSGQVRRG